MRRVITAIGAAVLTSAILPSAVFGAASREDVRAIITDIAHRPATIVAGVGSPHHAVTTQSAEAQAFYDQGLGWMHSYFWMESARSLHHALTLDEDLALAHVGLYVVYWNLGMRDLSKRHLDLAVDMRDTVSERERLYIEARAIQHRAMLAGADDRVSLRDDYRSALARALIKYPEDAEMWVARGQAAERAASGIGKRGSINGAAWYESALVRDPNHIGAHHYLLHCYENIRQYDLAVYHAEEYGERATAAPHGQHMVGHVLPRVDRWDDALERFDNAYRLEAAYYEREDIPPWADWHHLHNLHLFGMALLRNGDTERAGEVLREAWDTPGQKPVSEVHAHVPYLEYLLHTGNLEDAADRAGELAETHGPTGAVVGRAFAGEALLLQGRVDEAVALSDELDAAIEANFPNGITGRSRSFVRQFRAELALYEADFTTVFLVERDVLALADSLLREASFDGWGEGLFRIERMMRVAHLKGFDDLVTKLRERIGQLDATYTPSVDIAK
jgi:Tfp pilus assembly protein PilF